MGRNARDLCSMRVPSSRGTGRGATIALVGPNKFLSRGAIEVACDGCMQRGATAAEHVATFDSRGRGFVNWSRANADSTRRENRLGRYLVRDPFVRDSNLWSASRCRTPRITSLLLAREITAISFNGHLCPPLLPQRVILPSTVFSLEFEIKIICLRYSAINHAAWIHDLFHLPCHIAKTLSRNEKKIKKKKRKGKLKNEVDEVLTRKVKFNPHSGAKRLESKGKSPLVLILANYFSVVKHSRGGN